MMVKNPAYGTNTSGPEDARSPAVLTTDPSVTPPIYATINEKTSRRQKDGVGNENTLPVTGGVLEDKGGEGGGGSDVVYQVVDDPGV